MKSRKTKILYHSNQISLGGTDKTIQIFCKYLTGELFDVFVSYKKNNREERKNIFIELMGKDHLIAYKNENDLKRIMAELKPDILHVSRMGQPEFPENGQDVDAPIFVETNVFGLRDDNPRIDKTLFVSQWLKNYCTWAKGARYDFLPNPIESPLHNRDLREKYNLDNKIVIGRVGRPDDNIYDNIIIKALRKFKNDNIIFFPLAPPKKMVKDMKKLRIPSICIEPTTDEDFLCSYYNTIDILAHARLDGETFGCNIAEAMMHRRPVISHYSNMYNAHSELIENGINGYIVKKGKHRDYFKKLDELIINKEKRQLFGQNAQEKAMIICSAEQITKKLEDIYVKLLENKGLWH